MKRKTVVLLTNERSGQGKIRRCIYDILSIFSEAGYDVTVRPVFTMPMDEQITAEDQPDMVICAGGDGTLHHTINTMIRNHLDYPLAYIPMGTTNDFSRSLELPRKVEDICHAILDGEIIDYDIGKFNDEYFNYVAAFGVFSDASYTTRQEDKNLFGYAAYVVNAISNLPHYVSDQYHMTIHADSFEAEGNYIFGAVSNSMSIGGMRIKGFTRERLTDGKFDLFLIKAPQNANDLTEIALALSSGDYNHPYIEMREITRVEFESEEPTNWTLDGEFGGTHIKEVISLGQKVRMVVPKRK